MRGPNKPKKPPAQMTEAEKSRAHEAERDHLLEELAAYNSRWGGDGSVALIVARSELPQPRPDGRHPAGTRTPRVDALAMPNTSQQLVSDFVNARNKQPIEGCKVNFFSSEEQFSAHLADKADARKRRKVTTHTPQTAVAAMPAAVTSPGGA